MVSFLLGHFFIYWKKGRRIHLLEKESYREWIMTVWRFMMIICYFDTFEEWLLVSFWLDSPIHLIHFYSLFNLHGPENLRKPFTMAQNWFMCDYYFSIYYIILYYYVLLYHYILLSILFENVVFQDNILLLLR